MHLSYALSSRMSLVLILFFCTAWRSWVSPTQYSPRPRYAATAMQLDYLVLEVNGKRRLLKAGTQVEIVRGDTLKVIATLLKDRQRQAQYVNVVGFKNPPDNGKDRGYLVNTDKQLLPYFSQRGEGRVYAIVVGSRDKIHGEIFFRLLAPQLRYAVLRVNDSKSLVLRDGEPVRVGLDDRLTISNVSVNFTPRKGLTFDIYRDTSAAVAHEIRFARADKIFARIPLQIIAD